MRHPRPARRGGFTLLEILLAGMIAVILLSALLLLMHSVTAVRTSQEDAAGTEVLREIQEQMAGQLRHLTFGQSNACELAIEPGTLSFCAFEADAAGWHTLSAFRYSLLDDGGLEYVRHPRGGSANTNILLSGLTDFTVASHSDGVWHESMITSSGTDMIRLQMELESEETVSKTVFIPASMQMRSGLERR